MTLWTTIITAIGPISGELKEWFGPNVPGISQRDAELYCGTHLGYCRVWGKLIAEVPTNSDQLTPDMTKIRDYDATQNN